VIAIVAMLVVLLVPVMAAARMKAQKITCTNHLMQTIGGFCVWKNDQGHQLPMSASTNSGVTLEYGGDGEIFRQFQVISNKISTPEILVCPADTRKPAKDFGPTFGNTNISYFINLDATASDPQRLLMGDDNFEIGGVPVKSGWLEIWTNQQIAWSAKRHRFVGNIARADGSVQSFNNFILTNQLNQSGLVTNRLAIP